MSILVNKNTKIITQGITGKVGSFHTQLCKNYANGIKAFVAGVNPKKSGENFNKIPIFKSVKEAKNFTNATVSVIYVPAQNAIKAILEAITANIKLIICITEGIPIKDMLIIKNYILKTKSKTLLLGPNCPGIITPEEIKIGIMPSNIHKKGNIGIVSRSGTLTYEVVNQLTELGIGQSTVVGIGGDPINGLKYIDIIKKFNKDKNTNIIIMIGEIGGTDEIEAAFWIKKNIKKPVISYIAGLTAPKGKIMGHAGALITKSSDTAKNKLNILEECGIKTTYNISKIGKLTKSILKNNY